MKICCIGAGYVGGPTMAVIAQKCPDIDVHVVDISADRIAAWNSSNLEELPVFEPGLADVVDEARGRNLRFSTNVDTGIREADVIFISVNTPTKTYGVGAGRAADLKFVELCARRIAEHAEGNTIIVEKSTLPVRTAESIKSILDHSGSKKATFQVLSNPEFLAEGTAIRDLHGPDRVLVGGETTQEGDKAVQTLVDVYANWVPKEKIITTNLWSSELSKLTANAFLAQRISSIIVFQRCVRQLGRMLMKSPMRLGGTPGLDRSSSRVPSVLVAAVFRRTFSILSTFANTLACRRSPTIGEQVVIMNDYQKQRFTRRMVKSLYNTVSGKRIAVFGFAFKKDTNDTRESAAIYVCRDLLEEQAMLAVYDPKVGAELIHRDILGRPEVVHPDVEVCESPYAAVDNAHAIAILTEWDEFKELDWSRIYDSMLKPACIFDGRNVLDHAMLRKIGFEVFAIGKEL